MNSLKIVERAYLFMDGRKAFVSKDAVDLELLYHFQNSGKTPALTYEVYAEIKDGLPAIARAYPSPEHRMKIDISVQANSLGELGSAYRGVGGKAVFGYVKYRDVFGDDHITGWAAVYNPTVGKFEANGPGTDDWNYWT